MTKKVKKSWRIAVFTLLAVFGVILLMLGAISTLLATETGSRWALSTVTQRISEVEGNHLTIGESEGTLLWGLTLREIGYSNSTTEVSIEDIHVSWNPYSLLSSNFFLSEVGIIGLQMDLTGTPGTEQASGLADDELIKFSAFPIDIEIKKLELQRAQLQMPQQSYQLDRLTLNALLQQQNLYLSEIQLRAEAISVDGDLNVELAGYLPLQADFLWQYDSPVSDEIERLAGELRLGGDADVLQIEHLLQEPIDIRSVGSIQTGLSGSELLLDLSHSAETMILPIEQAAGYDFEEFSLRSTGTPFEFKLFLETKIESESVPTVELSMEALFQQDSLDVQDYRLATDSGSLSGSARVGWLDQITGSVNYELADQSPLSYFETTSPFDIIDLTSSGTIDFQLIEENVQGELNLESLAAQIGAFPFTGSGRISFLEETFRFSEMLFTTADNQLRFEGELSEDLDFSWQLEAPVLQQLMENLTGSVSASGELRGDIANPRASTQIEASSLQFEEIAVQNIKLSVEFEEGEVDSRLEVNEAGYVSDATNEQLDLLIVNILGNESNHKITGEGDASYGQVNFVIGGGFVDFTAREWQGNLLEAKLDTLIGQWVSTTETRIELLNSNITIDNSCWAQQEASLCIDLSPVVPEGLQILVNLQDYPLTVFNSPDALTNTSVISLPDFPYIPENLSLNGVASANLALLLGSSAGPSLDFTLDTTGAELLVKNRLNEEDLAPDEVLKDEQLYQMTNVNIAGQLQEGQWELESNIGFSRANIEEASVDLRGLIESELTIGDDQSLTGTVDARLEDMGWMSVLIPELSNVQGELSGKVNLGGSLQAPALTGNLTLEEGQLTVGQLGISLSQISASIISLDTGIIELNASMASSPGALDLKGTIVNPLTSERYLQAQISGTDFQIANTPDLHLELSPNVSLTASEETIELDGVLSIPVLALQLTQLPEIAVDVSRDAVVTNYPPDRPQLARSISAEQGTLFDIPIIADVDINLGENVTFSGFGMSARVDGNLNVQQYENGTDLTYGELNIADGSYEMYGQKLKIRQGKLLFFGAYDNPALDIRAVREVENVTAGVLMNGTLKSINSQLFSTPALADSEIIAILATGKRFSQIGEQDDDAMLGTIARLGLNRSQGLTNQVRDQLGLDSLAINNTGDVNNTMLTVGKYLTPDIFIRYGVGLFDKQSKLAIDYSISEHIKLQAETGEYQSVDVTYRVER